MKRILACALIIAAAFGASAAPWKPTKTIELVAPANPGGGWDMLCRVVQKSLVDEKLVEKNVIVVNKPGGGGSVGWTYLKGKKGQGEYLAATSTLLMLNQLLGSSELTYKDFTPIAALQSEWISITVQADSPYKSINDLMTAIKADPSAVPIGVGPTLGNNDHLLILRLAKSYGIDPAKLKFIVYPGAGGEIVPALLGGHIKCTTIGLAEVLEQHKAGKMRVLGVSSPAPLAFLPGVKTFKEQGLDVVFPHWRGIIAAPGLKPEQVAYWDGVFGKMVQTKTWKEQIEKLGWSDFYQNAAAHSKFLAEQTGIFDDLLTSVGLKK
ncbi:MAG TPA: tripartite tricarboxylate transporter substrate-binding protein [Spirochaetales bacterium]|nr:tripartite tricarboxylate transporter substrate-binding protein [Spirochaetales bacterium]